jgi:very-short-patch-repair endonuclease
MGKKNCNWGKHFSKETRKKMAKARIGKYRGKNHPMWRKRHSKEAIEKMKKIHKGQKGHGLGQTYEEYYGKNRAKEIKKKMKIAGVRKSKIYRGKNHWNFGKHLSIKTRMLIGKANKGKIISKKTRAKISLATSGDNNPSKHSGVGKKISATKRKQWENPLFVKKMLKAFAIRPNKPEKKLIGILRKHFPKDYKYTGDGKHGGFFGKAPDFANKKSKEFLEIFGRHWHEPEEEKERIAHFKKFGWDTLIIWEEELKNEEKLLERIKEFRGDGKDG